jgi:hypothetical protein
MPDEYMFEAVCPFNLSSGVVTPALNNSFELKDVKS